MNFRFTLSDLHIEPYLVSYLCVMHVCQFVNFAFSLVCFVVDVFDGRLLLQLSETFLNFANSKSVRNVRKTIKV